MRIELAGFSHIMDFKFEMNKDIRYDRTGIRGVKVRGVEIRDRVWMLPIHNLRIWVDEAIQEWGHDHRTKHGT